MRISTGRIAAVALAIAVWLVSAPADAMRCESRVISRGDHVTRLLRYCGEPALIQSREVQRALLLGSGTVLLPGVIENVHVEQWTYNLGPGRLMRLVQIENGFVTEVRRLGYGYRE